MATSLDIYFADRPHPGSNEITNGLLSQFFPKSRPACPSGAGYVEQMRPEYDNPPGVALTGWMHPLGDIMDPKSKQIAEIVRMRL